MAGKVAINGAPGAGVDGAGVIGVDVTVTGAGVLRGVEVASTFDTIRHCSQLFPTEVSTEITANSGE